MFMKRVMGLCLMLICVTCAYSQNTLNFCASVEQNGYCNFNNTKFITSQDSTNGRVFMQVKGAGGPIGVAKVIFKIYKVDKAGAEKFETMLQEDVKPEWYFAWMPYTFASPGKYSVKIFDESDKLICTNGFELIAFK
jgi:hypothetical protein